MSQLLWSPDSLKRLFSALTEHAFQVDLGVADPPLIDYVSDLLVRFVRVDMIFSMRAPSGRRLTQVAEMLAEAPLRAHRPQRELHRHIGDFTLFWVGVYPEALETLKSDARQDALVNYCEQGRRSYFIASTFDEEEFRDEAPVLRRLSDQFDVCTAGLKRVREEWKRLPEDRGLPTTP